jgi:dihydrodipicolinate synthase/N-acetylneuraminate lyase
MNTSTQSDPGPAVEPNGIWGAVLLPIDPAGEINWSALAEEVDILCTSDLAGIYTNGSAGEFYNQSEAEFEKLSVMVAEGARKHGKPFQIGVSHTNPRVARRRLEKVIGLNPTAVQFTLPDWWPPSRAEMERFVVGMSEAARAIPLVIYNPPHAKVQLGLNEIAGLAKLAPTLAGAKLSGGDSAWYAQRRRLLPGFSVFVPGHTVASGRSMGANGSYSNIACLSPNGAVRHWRLIETDPAAAQDLEARINRFLGGHILPLARAYGLSDPALDKLLAAAGGWGPVGPDLLWPYSSATSEHVAAAARAARNELPELFEAV